MGCQGVGAVGRAVPALWPIEGEAQGAGIPCAPLVAAQTCPRTGLRERWVDRHGAPAQVSCRAAPCPRRAPCVAPGQMHEILLLLPRTVRPRRGQPIQHQERAGRVPWAGWGPPEGWQGCLRRGPRRCRLLSPEHEALSRGDSSPQRHKSGREQPVLC